MYTIYYKGNHEHYRPLSETEHSIYVGKADPEAPSAENAMAQGVKLPGRLSEHGKSFRTAVTTLNIDDFDCRFLIVQPGFQKLAEDYLINTFKPIWNFETRIYFGLGKHGTVRTLRAMGARHGKRCIRAARGLTQAPRIKSRPP